MVLFCVQRYCYFPTCANKKCKFRQKPAPYHHPSLSSTTSLPVFSLHQLVSFFLLFSHKKRLSTTQQRLISTLKPTHNLLIIKHFSRTSLSLFSCCIHTKKDKLLCPIICLYQLVYLGLYFQQKIDKRVNVPACLFLHLHLSPLSLFPFASYSLYKFLTNIFIQVTP